VSIPVTRQKAPLKRTVIALNFYIVLRDKWEWKPVSVWLCPKLWYRNSVSWF